MKKKRKKERKTLDAITSRDSRTKCITRGNRSQTTRPPRESKAHSHVCRKNNKLRAKKEIIKIQTRPTDRVEEG